ncbi:MAG: chromate resistance protein ChrB domain-containing protein [Pseudomonadota bacterium]
MAKPISVSELNALIGTARCPAIFDVCIDEDFKDDPYLIPGSKRHPYRDIAGILDELGTAPAIIVCQKGLKLSQGVAAWLNAEGIEAHYLEGGMYGWRGAQKMRLPAAEIPTATDGPSLWAVQTDPDITQLTWLWLLKRFIERNARILFVKPDQVSNVAEKFGAATLPDTSSPDQELKNRYQLNDERLRTVLATANTNGIRRLWDGIKKLQQNDQTMLEAGLAICDALYAYTGKDQVSEL